jgi:hypothetical protein
MVGTRYASALSNAEALVVPCRNQPETDYDHPFADDAPVGRGVLHLHPFKLERGRAPEQQVPVAVLLCLQRRCSSMLAEDVLRDTFESYG